MVTKRNKLYNPEAYSYAYKVFLLNNVMTLTSDLEKQYGSFSHDGDQVYQVVWFWSLRFGLYPAYKVFLQSNATTLTFKDNKVFPLMTVIKYTMLYDSRAYGSVSILPSRFFLVSNATILTFDLPLRGGIDNFKNLYELFMKCSWLVHDWFVMMVHEHYSWIYS
jgi:hypothetical protein